MKILLKLGIFSSLISFTILVKRYAIIGPFIIFPLIIFDLEKQIREDLNLLTSNDSLDQLYNKKDKDNKIYIKSDDLIEDYLNELSEFKINSDSTIVNNKDYDKFVKYDIKRTKNIIDFIEKNKEFSIKNNINEEERFKTKETDNKNIDEFIEDKDYQKLKKELENTEKNALELIGKFAKLLDRRDKYIKQSSRPSLPIRHSIKSYSTKLANIYYNEEKLCELNSEEKPAEKCNCSLDRLKNCFIY